MDSSCLRSGGLASLGLLAVLLAGCSEPLPEIGSSAGASTTPDPTGPEPLTSTGTGTGSGSGGADGTGTASGTADTSEPSGCCTPHAGPSCDDPELAACVCTQEPTCCAFGWEAGCAELAVQQCGGCGAATGTTTGDTTTAGDTGPAPGTCCTPLGQPGCPEDPGLEACVCAVDAFCCEQEWDGTCIQTAQGDCGLECAAAGDCCTAHGAPGCDDAPTDDCVCAIDPFCCNDEWDALCVDEAQYACGAACGLPPNTGDCCAPQPMPACGDVTATACVCLVDAGCCQDAWSQSCVVLAVNACGIMCPGVEPLDPCCFVQPGPTCGNAAVEACVCAFDQFCCDDQWDGQCVGEAQNDCMLEC